MVQGTEDWTLGVKPHDGVLYKLTEVTPEVKLAFNKAYWCGLKTGEKVPDPSLPTCPFQIANL